jgi:hypothetical protein
MTGTIANDRLSLIERDMEKRISSSLRCSRRRPSCLTQTRALPWEKRVGAAAGFRPF